MIHSVQILFVTKIFQYDPMDFLALTKCTLIWKPSGYLGMLKNCATLKSSYNIWQNNNKQINWCTMKQDINNTRLIIILSILYTKSKVWCVNHFKVLICVENHGSRQDGAWTLHWTLIKTSIVTKFTTNQYYSLSTNPRKTSLWNNITNLPKHEY